VCVSKGGDTLSTSKGFKPIGSNSNYPKIKKLSAAQITSTGPAVSPWRIEQRSMN